MTKLRDFQPWGHKNEKGARVVKEDMELGYASWPHLLDTPLQKGEKEETQTTGITPSGSKKESTQEETQGCFFNCINKI